MSMINTVQMTVKSIISAPGRGVLVAGRIEGGSVHVGDALQVHNGQSGATGRVGQISLGSKLVKEAAPGDEALLLLENLSEADVHPGDRLVPGKESAVVIADQGARVKLPTRIEPILHVRQLVGKITMLAFLSLFWIIPLGMMAGGGIDPFFFVFWYAIVSVITFFVARGLVRGLRARRRFLYGQVQTTAHILRRRVVEHSDKYGTSYSYYLQLEFNPTLAAVSTGSLQLEAAISRKLYESLADSESVTVSYAVEDPRIFVLEGE